MRMGNPTESQLVFEHWRPSDGPVPHRVGRRNPERHRAELTWRKELVEASKPAQGSPPEPEEQPTLRYKVELDFFVSDTSLDLDNLTKPVLDTLFSPGPPLKNQEPWQEVIGKVFPAAHDSRVFELVQRKTVVSGSERQGIRVKVSWTRE
jgi:hypothetical protein